MRALLLALLLLPLAVHAQPDPLRVQYEAAFFAHDAGAYPDALEGFIALLDKPGGDAYRRDIALQTGEWHLTTELTDDGGAPRWSPSGQYVAYETGNGPTVRTYVAGLDGHVVAEVEGRELAFRPDGAEAAYLHVPESPARTALRAEMDSLLAARDFPTFVQRRNDLYQQEAEAAQLMRLDLTSGRAAPWPAEGGKTELAWGREGALYVLGAPSPDGRTLQRVQRSDAEHVAMLPGAASSLHVLPGGARALVEVGRSTFLVIDLASGALTEYAGNSATVSADGSTLAYLVPGEGENTLTVERLDAPGAPIMTFASPDPIGAPALSADGGRVAVQMMPREDWDVYVWDTADAESLHRLTWDIQHDLFPRFLDAETLLVVKGEARHRRAYVYDLASGDHVRLFHNNTVRTVAPQYAWVVSPDGHRVLIVAERDGDTVSPERGVYLVDRAQTVSKANLLTRLRTQLAGENDLRTRGEALFAPIADAVREVTEAVSVGRIYSYERDLYRFGSKYITEPGNAAAIAYLAATLRRFGYTPELQWFEPRDGVRTANVIATLPGTTDPNVTYVVSSHFDSVQRGPGADDNTSGTAALLEAARVLADRPQPATLQFAFFTGEEAGLLGSREFVRLAQENDVLIAGALNNDMIGYANDHRLDNTIRYSNPGLRDVQHAAALGFTDLILYDAKYYKNTDAHAYYDAYGDIVAGIGSYPILANPHYHQTHDVLETINHRLVAEVSKTTAATLMLMASRPARLSDLEVQHVRGSYTATWAPAPESDVAAYRVAYGPADDPMRHTGTVNTPNVALPEAAPGWVIAVRAIATDGDESWDWAVTEIE